MTAREIGKRFGESAKTGSVPTWLLGLVGASLYAIGYFLPDQRGWAEAAFLSVVGSILNAGRVGFRKSAESLPDAVSERLWRKMGAQGNQHDLLAAAVADNKLRCEATAQRIEGAEQRIEHAESRLDNHDHHIRVMSPALKEVAEACGVRYEPLVNLVGPMRQA